MQRFVGVSTKTPISFANNSAKPQPIPTKFGTRAGSSGSRGEGKGQWQAWIRHCVRILATNAQRPIFIKFGHDSWIHVLSKRIGRNFRKLSIYGSFTPAPQPGFSLGGIPLSVSPSFYFHFPSLPLRSETDSWCACWLLMVILAHVCNFASVEVFNKALLAYLLTYFSSPLLAIPPFHLPFFSLPLWSS